MYAAAAVRMVNPEQYLQSCVFKTLVSFYLFIFVVSLYFPAQLAGELLRSPAV